jgi:hypothetical protein
MLLSAKRERVARGPWFNVAVQFDIAAFRTVHTFRIEPFRVRRIGLPAGIKPVLIGMKQEYERIAERNMGATHIHEAMHVIVCRLHLGSHRSKVGLVQNPGAAGIGDPARGQWRAGNISEDIGARVGWVIGDVAVIGRSGYIISGAEPGFTD